MIKGEWLILFNQQNMHSIMFQFSCVQIIKEDLNI